MLIKLVLLTVKVVPVIGLVGMPPQRSHGVVFVGDGLGVELGRGRGVVVVVRVGDVVAFGEQDAARVADARE